MCLWENMPVHSVLHNPFLHNRVPYPFANWKCGFNKSLYYIVVVVIICSVGCSAFVSLFFLSLPLFLVFYSLVCHSFNSLHLASSFVRFLLFHSWQITYKYTKTQWKFIFNGMQKRNGFVCVNVYLSYNGLAFRPFLYKWKLFEIQRSLDLAYRHKHTYARAIYIWCVTAVVEWWLKFRGKLSFLRIHRNSD